LTIYVEKGVHVEPSYTASEVVTWETTSRSRPLLSVFGNTSYEAIKTTYLGDE